jgi:predicted HD superfamily hydrolase involved in NAD metabolism
MTADKHGLKNALYTPKFEVQVSAWVKTQIGPDRLDHVNGVVETAARLAARYAPDQVERVRLAGWIHDVAKDWDDAALLAYAESHHLPISPTERAVPLLLHGAVGYALAAEQFGLDDPLLQSACALHTTGAPGMTVVDKIAFVADLIEPTRAAHRVGDVRRAVDLDLDAGVLCAVDTVLRHLIRRQRIIDPRAFDLRNQLLAAGVRYAKA